MKILVVDDEVPIREMLHRGLTQMGGFSVEVAQNGRVAVEKFEKEIFDLVLTDVKMPERELGSKLNYTLYCSTDLVINKTGCRH